jgi:hypothetical protein
MNFSFEKIFLCVTLFNKLCDLLFQKSDSMLFTKTFKACMMEASGIFGFVVSLFVDANQ